MAVMSLGSLPLGYRFRPTDAELVDHYLRLKINGDDKNSCVIREIDVCMHEPWDLPDLSALPTKDSEWFFFCPRGIRHSRGSRLNRATREGSWKATGKDREIKLNGKLIGMKKTLVFYIGRAPKGQRTHWVMHEYRTTLEELDGMHPGQVRRDDVDSAKCLMFHESAFVLCRSFNKQDQTMEDSNLVDSPTTVEDLEMTQDSPSPSLLAGPSVDHETKRRANDLPAHEVSFQRENDSTFDYPLMNPLSLPLQMKQEMRPSGHDQLNCGRVSVGDDNDLMTFLDSIVIDGNDGDSIQGSVSEQFHPMGCSLADEDEDFGCSEAKLNDIKDRDFSSVVGEAPSASCDRDSESLIETGIKIRPRPQVEVTTSPKVAAQGDASRRVRVQRKLRIGPGPEQSNGDQESKTIHTKETKTIKVEEQPEVVSSTEARAKDDVNGGVWSSTEYKFLIQWKGLLLPCSSIRLLRFFIVLVLSLVLIGTLFWPPSSS